tara:strand:- start:403 stop:693 length:291 start_codon:yes stop_codon:yes gene_type:complete
MATLPLEKPQFERRFKCGCVSQCTCHEETYQRFRIEFIYRASEFNKLLNELDEVLEGYDELMEHGYGSGSLTVMQEAERVRKARDLLMLTKRVVKA